MLYHMKRQVKMHYNIFITTVCLLILIKLILNWQKSKSFMIKWYITCKKITLNYISDEPDEDSTIVITQASKKLSG